ncbi:hypothetical protein V2J97_00005, partial [Pseudomonas alliivorans]|nr:hypothetical protein [Pseudomonas alliivorans]
PAIAWVQALNFRVTSCVAGKPPPTEIVFIRWVGDVTWAYGKALRKLKKRLLSWEAACQR